MLSKPATESIRNCFRQLNLSPDHASVYLACLEEGSAPASQIAKRSKVPRSTTYGLLDDLVKQGLISCVTVENTKNFTSESPERLHLLLSEKASEVDRNLGKLSKDLPFLNVLHRSHEPQFPKIRFYEGEGGLETVYYKALKSDEILIISQGSADVQTSLSDDPDYLKDFIEQVGSRKIPTRELLEENPAVREYKEKYSSANHEIIVMPSNPQTAFGHVDKHIYMNKVAYISHDNLVAVVIEDETVAEHERAQFESLWDYYSTI